MDQYTVKLYSRAYRDLDEIYFYIAEHLSEPIAASKMIDALENTIFSLETFLERGAIRRVGAYANQGYRQLFCKSYTIILSRAERKERGAYHHGTIYTEKFLTTARFCKRTAK